MDTPTLIAAARLRRSYEDAVNRLTDRYQAHVYNGNDDGAEGADILVKYMRTQIVDLTGLINDLLDSEATA